jgi:hypothetical protein
MSESKEKRLAKRFPTFCRVEFDSGSYSCSGVTRDLSTKGVCFITDKPLELEQMLRCFILMEKKGGNLTRLRGEGKVVRVDKCAEGWEIGVHFTTFEW